MLHVAPLFSRCHCVTPEFPISIAELDAGGREYTFVLRAAWVRGALEDTDATTTGKDGTLDVRVSKSGRDVVVHGHIDVDLETQCARCLNDVTLHLHHPITALMVPASETRSGNAKGDDDLPSDELDVTPYAGETISLDDLVRDELVLEVPIVPLCSEDCAGISPPPTKDGDAPGKPAIDPRLLPLLRLKNSTEKKE